MWCWNDSESVHLCTCWHTRNTWCCWAWYSTRLIQGTDPRLQSSRLSSNGPCGRPGTTWKQTPNIQVPNISWNVISACSTSTSPYQFITLLNTSWEHHNCSLICSTIFVTSLPFGWTMLSIHFKIRYYTPNYTPRFAPYKPSNKPSSNCLFYCLARHPRAQALNLGPKSPILIIQ